MCRWRRVIRGYQPFECVSVRHVAQHPMCQLHWASPLEVDMAAGKSRCHQPRLIHTCLPGHSHKGPTKHQARRRRSHFAYWQSRHPPQSIGRASESARVCEKNVGAGPGATVGWTCVRQFIELLSHSHWDHRCGRRLLGCCFSGKLQ